MFFTNLPPVVVRELMSPLSGVTHSLLGASRSRGLPNQKSLTKQVRCYCGCVKLRTNITSATNVTQIKSRASLKTNGVNIINCPIGTRGISGGPIGLYLDGRYSRLTARGMSDVSGGPGEKRIIPKVKLVITREMKRPDAQPYGTINNGALVELLDEAGLIFSSERCSQSLQDNGLSMATGYLENIEFIEAMSVGEVVEVYAQMGYTSPQAVQVILKVMALNLDKDEWRVVGHARLWYSPVRREGSQGSQEEAPILTRQPTGQSSEALNREGHQSFESMKRVKQELKSREHTRRNLIPIKDFLTSVKPDSITKVNNIIQIVRPAPSAPTPDPSEGPLEGLCENWSGLTVRLMDEVGCLAASNHSQNHCISANIQSTVLLQPIHSGSRLIARSWPIFSNTNSLEVKVEIDEQRTRPGEVGEVRERVAEGIVTCQALDEFLQPQTMLEFKPNSDEATKTFEERRRVHEERTEVVTGDKTSSKTSRLFKRRHSFNVGL